VAELINTATDENITSRHALFRIQTTIKDEKKVSFQALQANELIKFLPKKELIILPKRKKLTLQKGCFSLKSYRSIIQVQVLKHMLI
jgi:hypothetical protein